MQRSILYSKTQVVTHHDQRFSCSHNLLLMLVQTQQQYLNTLTQRIITYLHAVVNQFKFRNQMQCSHSKSGTQCLFSPIASSCTGPLGCMALLCGPIRRSANFSFLRRVHPLHLGHNVMEQKAKCVPSGIHQVCLENLRLQFLRSFQHFLKLKFSSSNTTSKTVLHKTQS
ncbi:hypothetical protein H5410_046100 [Solanum commersonii]|uniref:Uncharacterized protein n=1 Tax=Solanum commersonii TaxID=4109 RepID=A0A9J5XD69_SOLCO|nr:hypothetical protein H5410_046100 [Solanum commersonii]